MYAQTCVRTGEITNNHATLQNQRKGSTMSSGYGMMVLRGSLSANWSAWDSTAIWDDNFRSKRKSRLKQHHYMKTRHHRSMWRCAMGTFGLKDYFDGGYCPRLVDLRQLLSLDFFSALSSFDRTLGAAMLISWRLFFCALYVQFEAYPELYWGLRGEPCRWLRFR